MASWAPGNSYGPAAHRHGDGNGHHAGERGPVLPVGGGRGGDVGDPWGGAGYLHCYVPCPGRIAARNGTADPGRGVLGLVAAT